MESRRTFLRATGTATLLAATGAAAVAQEDDQGDEERGIETFALGGQVPGWEGLAPDPIDDETNPTLELVAGETYRVVWRNEDGEPHNFSLIDDDGGTLPALRVLDVPAEQVDAVLDATGETLRTAEDLEIVEAEETPAEDDEETETPAEDDEETETPAEDDEETETPSDLTAVTETIGQEDAAQAVEFEATEEMAQYQCQVHPDSMVGDLEITSEESDDSSDPEVSVEL